MSGAYVMNPGNVSARSNAALRSLKRVRVNLLIYIIIFRVMNLFYNAVHNLVGRLRVGEKMLP